MTGREWLASCRLPIVEGDVINDMEIEFIRPGAKDGRPGRMYAIEQDHPGATFAMILLDDGKDTFLRLPDRGGRWTSTEMETEK